MGRVPRRRPVGARPRRSAVVPGRRTVAPGGEGRRADADSTHAGCRPVLRVVDRRQPTDRRDRAVVASQEDAPLPHRPRTAVPTSPAASVVLPSGSARPTSSSVRSSPAARDCSRRARRRVQAVPRPGAGGAVRRGPQGGRRRSRRIHSNRSSRTFERTPLAAASIAQVHAATLHTGEEVVVKVQRPSVARLVRKDLRVMAWLAPHLVGRIPIASLANPPALVELFAETIVEELDFRMEAANMIDIAVMLHELQADGLRRAPPAPVAGHASSAGDGTHRRIQLRRRRRDEGRRRRHRGGRAHGDGRADRRGDGLRRLPRRPARRQPVRAARRSHGAARLRHRRPADQRSTAGVPADDGRARRPTM